MAAKMHKIGQLWTKKDDDNKFYIKLGDKNKNSDFDLTVEIIVKNSKGEIVAQRSTEGEDGLFLALNDPRTKPNITPSALAGLEKVPNLKFDVLLGSD
jgi:hypothetical protein